MAVGLYIIIATVLCSSVTRLKAQQLDINAWRKCDEKLLNADFADCLCGFTNQSNEDVVALKCQDLNYRPSIISTLSVSANVVPFAYRHLRNVTITGNNFIKMPVCEAATEEAATEWNLLLVSLDLSNNNIHFIPSGAFRCQQLLDTLVLNDNNLAFSSKMSNAEMFSELEILQVLHLRNAFNFDRQRTSGEVAHSIAAVFEASDVNLVALKELNLESNCIESLSTSMFTMLSSLERLYLSDNQLTDPVLPTHCSYRSCQLREVYLNSNAIARLSPEFRASMDGMKGLRKLDVSDNPFWCDCGFRDTYAWLKLKAHQHRLVNANRMTCSGPPSVAGRTVLSLLASDMHECVEGGGDDEAGMPTILSISCPKPAVQTTETEGPAAPAYSLPLLVVVLLMVAVCVLTGGVLFIRWRKNRDTPYTVMVN